MSNTGRPKCRACGCDVAHGGLCPPCETGYDACAADVIAWLRGTRERIKGTLSALGLCGIDYSQVNDLFECCDKCAESIANGDHEGAASKAKG
jgi:hypothetical protein